jgi:DNA-binding MarR family transcriptional regulator
MDGRLDQARALRLWHGALAESVRRDGPDLSARQMAILLTVYIDPDPHTVRGLSAGLAISKPAVTRALDRLVQLGYVRRVRDEADRRSVLVRRTVRGSVYLSEFAELVDAAHFALLR